MKAVVLAAGEGKRMWPLTETRPKVMLPLAGKPILEHLLLEVKKAGVSQFIFIVGHRAERVQDYFDRGERWGVRIDYLVQKRQLGTAHALGVAREMLKEPFLLLNGDILAREEDIRRLMAQEWSSLSLTEVAHPEELGVVEVQGSRVLRIHEKVKHPPTNLANAGLYRLTPEVFPAIERTPKSPRGEYELTDSLQILIDEGHPLGCIKIGYWLDLSYPWDLLEANPSLMQDLQSRVLGQVEERAVLKGPVVVGKGTLIRSHSYIEGPAIIGDNCDLGPHCYIRPYTTVGDGCHIGASVEVKNSVIMKGAKVPHLNYVGDSILGEDCNLGAGTKVANLRLDKGEVVIAGVRTGRQKLGVILGDGVQTGINACLNVGTMVGSNAFIGPGAIASGVIQSGSRIH